MTIRSPSLLHLHLISDSTGETLRAISRAATVQYPHVRSIEHVHPLVRTERQVNRVMDEVGQTPGIILYTIVQKGLGEVLERRASELAVPCVPVLNPVLQMLETYLGTPHTPIIGGQHLLDAEYFRRIDALNFTMHHDDGHLPNDLNTADIILLGVSRTSKTPTSIYLANRGYKTTNVPIINEMPLPELLDRPTTAFVVCLVASPDRIAQIRRNRVMVSGDRNVEGYVDRNAIAAEVAYSRRLCSGHNWPLIDVTRRSIEETAATIIEWLEDRKAGVEVLGDGYGDD